MKYRKQGYKACLVYALWQIGVIDERTVKEYELDKVYENATTQDKWIKKNVPQLKWFDEESLVVISSNKDSLEGRGIVVLSEEGLSIYHAISYENGVVLDADKPEERMSLEEYLRRFPHKKLFKILPIVELRDWRRKWINWLLGTK